MRSYSSDFETYFFWTLAQADTQPMAQTNPSLDFQDQPLLQARCWISMIRTRCVKVLPSDRPQNVHVGQDPAHAPDQAEQDLLAAVTSATLPLRPRSTLASSAQGNEHARCAFRSIIAASGALCQNRVSGDRRAFDVRVFRENQGVSGAP